MRSGSRAASAEHGFAYVLLLVLLAVMAVAAAGSVQLGATMSRRHAEEALLLAGEEFRISLVTFRAAAPAGSAAGPAELADLLRDPRVPGLRRHLRRIPADPLSGRAEWGLVRDGAGRIVAVHSLAEGRPIKRVGFEPHQAGFDEAETYAQWQFGLVPLPAVRTTTLSR